VFAKNHALEAAVIMSRAISESSCEGAKVKPRVGSLSRGTLNRGQPKRASQGVGLDRRPGWEEFPFED